MDKKVILAVAGSGKTTHIINQLALDTRSLIITYTHNNIKNLRDGIFRRFDYVPKNITVMPYFTFLYSFCFRPFLSYQLKTRGINYNRNTNKFAKQSEPNYFMDKNRRVYSNRLGKLIKIHGILQEVIRRIEKYYDNLFIDEIQDFAGHDFNLLKSISEADVEITFVGDFYQHTFDTSRDRNVNNSLHDDYNVYKSAFTKMGMTVDCEILNKSYRCSPAICKFISDKIGIEIYSHRNDETKIQIIETEEQADDIYQNKEIVKLFYREHYKYGCRSRNWGDCKGENRYGDVCVVLNKISLNLFRKSRLEELKPQTRNKLYVACSRTSHDLYFLPEKYYGKYRDLG